MTETESAASEQAATDRAEARLMTIRQETKVGWFDVRQMLATGAKTLTSTIVGLMSGRRELMAALDPRPPNQPSLDYDYAEPGELWIDYVADTGEGWDSTYSVAYLVGRNALHLRQDGEPTPQPIPPSGTDEAAEPTSKTPAIALPGGRVLIFGGDEVYPTASAAAYQARLQDPYRCARLQDALMPERHVYAIPGNHDWYDGLTAFIRLFCQRRTRTIGIWRTQQRRSYFAIRLHEGWWLWGADLALEDDLDPSQLGYFIDQAEMLQAGDRVILCSPTPAWVIAHDPQARQRLEVKQQADKFALIEEQVRRKGAAIVLAIAGDLHHYARHEVTHGPMHTNYIVCGGGGAFTLGTSRQPSLLQFADGSTAALRASFPSDAQSRAMRWWALLFPLLSPGFTALLTAYQLLLLYFLHSVSRLTALVEMSRTNSPTLAWFDLLATTEFRWWSLPDLLVQAFQILLADGMTFLYAFALVGGCVAFARGSCPEGSRRFVWFTAGTLHGVSQLVIGIICCWVVAQAVAHVMEPGSLTFVVAFTIVTAVLIYVVGGVLFGAYLLVSNLVVGLHEQEVFSCQAIEEFKCFLRICISKDGATRSGYDARPSAGSRRQA